MMARGLYKNLVTHLVMLEGEGLIETEDIAVAVVEAQDAARKKDFKLYQHINDEALSGRGKANLEETSLSLMDVSDLLTPVKVQKQATQASMKEAEGEKEKVLVRAKQSSTEGVKHSELGERKEGEEEDDVMLFQMETDAALELSGGGDEKEGKRRRRSLKEEWLVRINNRMEENKKKKKEDEELEMYKKKEDEDISSSSFLSLSSSSSNDSMPVLSDQSKEGPCLLLSSPPVLDVRIILPTIFIL